MPLISTARADEPDCVPYNTASPTPSITAAPTCYPAKTCSGCSVDPSCTPPPWPNLQGNEPPMTPIPSPQPGDGTVLEWRVYPPGFTFSTATPTPTSTPTPGPGVVVVHGGNWFGGDPFYPDIERVCELLAQSGFWVFAGDYRLAPCGRITNQPAHNSAASGRPPEQTDDVMALMMAARNSPQCSGHKVGILGVSVGGFLGAYVALYRNEIDISGRPHWNPSGVDYRPDCVVTFSSPFDLSDQIGDDMLHHIDYLQDLQNYIGNCSLTDARSASPISLIDSATKDSFKPMYIIQAEEDHVNPSRQVDDLTIALNAAQVNPCKYVVSFIPSGQGSGHALALWPHEDPNNPGHTIGQSVLGFFHRYLDD
jgi:acetyl esterase/lipase